MKYTLIGATALAFALQSAPALAAATEDLTSLPQYQACETNVKERLQEHNLDYGQMSDTDWQVQYLGRTEERQPSKIQFEGRPQTCSDGKVVVELDQTLQCEVENIYTTGDCQVDGLSKQ